MEFHILSPQNPEHELYPHLDIATFLHTHLEQYGDPLEDIQKCIQYALNPNRGGFVLIGTLEGDMAVVTVVNHTGM